MIIAVVFLVSATIIAVVATTKFRGRRRQAERDKVTYGPEYHAWLESGTEAGLDLYERALERQWELERAKVLNGQQAVLCRLAGHSVPQAGVNHCHRCSRRKEVDMFTVTMVTLIVLVPGGLLLTLVFDVLGI